MWTPEQSVLVSIYYYKLVGHAQRRLEDKTTQSYLSQLWSKRGHPWLTWHRPPACRTNKNDRMGPLIESGASSYSTRPNNPVCQWARVQVDGLSLHLILICSSLLFSLLCNDIQASSHWKVELYWICSHTSFWDSTGVSHHKGISLRMNESRAMLLLLWWSDTSWRSRYMFRCPVKRANALLPVPWSFTLKPSESAWTGVVNSKKSIHSLALNQHSNPLKLIYRAQRNLICGCSQL